jgi:hypothetical protein
LTQSYGELNDVTRVKGYLMALGFVLLGIATGLVVAGCVLAMGGGLGLAVLAYTGGGLAGMVGGLLGRLVPVTILRHAAHADHH